MFTEKKVDFPILTASERIHSPNQMDSSWVSSYQKISHAMKPDATTPTTCVMENILHDLAISDEEMYHLDPYEIFIQTRRKLFASHYNVDGRHPADRYLTQKEAK